MNRLVRRKLLLAQRFLVVEAAWASLGWWIAAGLAVWTGIRAVDFWLPLPRIWHTVGLILPLLVVVTAAATGAWRWRRLALVASESDARTKTHDRFVTALHLPASSPFAAPLERDILTFAAAWRPSQVFRGRLSRRAAWLAVPVVLLAGLEAVRWHDQEASAAAREAARELVTQAKNAAARQAPTDPQLQAAQELLREALKKLERSSDPQRDALRALDEAARQASGSSQGLSPEETEALASALASRDPQTAESLRDRQFAEAADAMEKMDPAALAQALKEAAQHRELTRLQELAQQGAAEAQAQLGSLTRESAGSEGSQARQKFLSALQQIKDRNLSGQGTPEQSMPGSNPALAENPPGSEPGSPSPLDDAPPGGRPGTEADLGRGADVAGETEPEAAAARDEFLGGQAGEGAAMTRMLRTSANDDPEARRAVRQTYEAAAAAALDAIENESIPPGSRLLVRKYFEAIRPAK